MMAQPHGPPLLPTCVCLSLGLTQTPAQPHPCSDHTAHCRPLGREGTGCTGWWPGVLWEGRPGAEAHAGPGGRWGYLGEESFVSGFGSVL